MQDIISYIYTVNHTGQTLPKTSLSYLAVLVANKQPSNMLQLVDTNVTQVSHPEQNLMSGQSVPAPGPCWTQLH